MVRRLLRHQVSFSVEIQYVYTLRNQGCAQEVVQNQQEGEGLGAGMCPLQRVAWKLCGAIPDYLY